VMPTAVYRRNLRRQVDADWRQLKCKIGDKGRKRGDGCRHDRKAKPRATRACAPNEQ
jgi:hypothetical protein